MKAQRPVLLPQGVPERVASHQALFVILRRCGGDLMRVIDAPARRIEAFGRHIERLRALGDGRKPLVVLSETTPLILAVIANRRLLERAAPSTVHWPWLLFVDPDVDPFFEREARSTGELDAPLDEAPIWTSASGQHYLVTVPGARGCLETRVKEMLSLSRRDSTPSQGCF